MDAFINDVMNLTDTMQEHWREKGAELLKENALRIESYIEEEVKSKAYLKH